MSAEWCGRLSRNPRHVVHGCGVVARRKLYTHDLVQDARAQLRVGKSAPDTDVLLGADFDFYISVCVAKGPRGFSDCRRRTKPVVALHDIPPQSSQKQQPKGGHAHAQRENVRQEQSAVLACLAVH